MKKDTAIWDADYSQAIRYLDTAQKTLPGSQYNEQVQLI